MELWMYGRHEEVDQKTVFGSISTFATLHSRTHGSHSTTL
jgi:hypothetical protein